MEVQIEKRMFSHTKINVQYICTLDTCVYPTRRLIGESNIHVLYVKFFVRNNWQIL